MSVTLPTREVYNVDVPEVQGVNAKFVYNFFVADESVNDSGGIPASVLKQPAGETNESYFKLVSSRAPRYVLLKFKPVKLNPAGFKSDIGLKNSSTTINGKSGMIVSSNVDSIVPEDNFASSDFISLSFHDGDIDDKMFFIMSGTIAQDELFEGSDVASEAGSFAKKALSLLPKSSGVRFFDSNNSRVFNNEFANEKSVNVNAQINGKFIFELLDRSVKDPHSQYTDELVAARNDSLAFQDLVLKNAAKSVSEQDYKTFIKYVEVKAGASLGAGDPTIATIVGYVIDKIELLPGGRQVVHDSITIDNPNSTMIIDPRVKYGTTYKYFVRAVALIVAPAINDNTGELATVKVLISSRPSNVSKVTTIETTAPPPPNDLNVTWDYDRENPTTAEHDYVTNKPIPGTGIRGSLMVHWMFPPNSQRDIKKFQVFRRRSITQPFELIKQYDFDDSVVKADDPEDPDPRLVELVSSPYTFFYDDEFNKGSRFIYAVGSIDAHGMVSNYSAQFEVWFDEFKNQLQKRLISHSGAPKPYPNLYLNADTFVDAIKVSGQHTKQAKLYFTPRHYDVIDSAKRVENVVKTSQLGGKYVFSFINLDRQQQELLDVTLNDMRSLPQPEADKPTGDAIKQKKFKFF